MLMFDYVSASCRKSRSKALVPVMTKVLAKTSVANTAFPFAVGD